MKHQSPNSKYQTNQKSKVPNNKTNKKSRPRASDSSGDRQLATPNLFFSAKHEGKELLENHEGAVWIEHLRKTQIQERMVSRDMDWKIECIFWNRFGEMWTKTLDELVGSTPPVKSNPRVDILFVIEKNSVDLDPPTPKRVLEILRLPCTRPVTYSNKGDVIMLKHDSSPVCLHL
jgi:hypothetical protein